LDRVRRRREDALAAAFSVLDAAVVVVGVVGGAVVVCSRAAGAVADGAVVVVCCRSLPGGSLIVSEESKPSEMISPPVRVRAAVVSARAVAAVVVRFWAGLCGVVCAGWVVLVAAGANSALSPPSSENAATAMNRLVVAAAGAKNQTHFLPIHKHLPKSALLRYP
jgi:hypothetical protein